MSDWQELTEEDFLGRMLRSYTCIGMVCSLLPIPISLPRPEIGGRFGDHYDAIVRVSEISEEIPVPETVAAALFTSCTYWLTAYDVFTAFMGDPQEHRANAFALCVLGSEGALETAVEWLAGEEE
ncbi:hypothetical protein [Streptomyces sp. NPDC051162]|uniref:hypothetical protein n=1 Tax=unclassified Streptomyces TaxID=2593676 RepID=UPI0034130040